MALNVIYSQRGPLDSLVDKMSALEVELGYERLVEGMKKGGKSDTEIATKLVDKWIEGHGYMCFISGIKLIASLPEDSKYLNEDYWSEKLKSEYYTKEFWIPKYKELTLSTFIPEDPFDRMVLYFLRDWIKDICYDYIVDDNVPEKERLVVLQKQVENFVFFAIKKPYGGNWKVFSEPDKLLQEALSLHVSDSDSDSDDSNETGAGKESQFTTVSGRRITVRVDKNIPKTAGDGPKLDQLDKDIFGDVRRYAAERLGETAVHKLWTMVRGSFKHPTRNQDVRCYAFSGNAASSKELHHMPGEWWKECDLPHGKEEIHVVNVDVSQFGHSMVLVLFNVLKPLILEDLKKLALHIAFDEKNYAEALIRKGRKDVDVIDYGYFYDSVVKIMNLFDGKIKETIKKGISNLTGEDDAEKLVEDKEIWKCISVGGQNKKFEPNSAHLGELLSKSISNNPQLCLKVSERMKEISQNILSKLQKKIGESPKEFLDKLQERLQQSNCGEDNVVSSILHQLLLSNNDDAFLSVIVTFVAMDAEHTDSEGKPFCCNCAHKVMFYSVLPRLLRVIGSTGKDFDQLSDLFYKLRETSKGNTYLHFQSNLQETVCPILY